MPSACISDASLSHAGTHPRDRAACRQRRRADREVINATGHHVVGTVHRASELPHEPGRKALDQFHRALLLYPS
jgi:hypothetical protein